MVHLCSLRMGNGKGLRRKRSSLSRMSSWRYRVIEWLLYGRTILYKVTLRLVAQGWWMGLRWEPRLYQGIPRLCLSVPERNGRLRRGERGLRGRMFPVGDEIGIHLWLGNGHRLLHQSAKLRRRF